MTGPRVLNLGMSSAVGLTWGGAMWVFGLSTIAAPPWWLGAGSPARLLAGAACIAGGQFVFMVLAADRWFPRAMPRARAFAELTLLAVFVAASIAAVGVMWMGAGQ